MILVDEYLAVLVISGTRPDPLGDGAVALTYGRAYRLTRALIDVGPGRLQVKEDAVRFGDPDSATETVRRAARELGIDLALLTT